MNKNKKILAIIGISTAAVGALAAGSLAFFTDGETKDTKATAGNVTIEMGELDISNSENINPGDNDESVSSERAGTPHNLTFKVANAGNKSIMTRNVITLTVNGSEALPASVYSLKTDEDSELTEKYVLVNGTFIPASEASSDAKIMAVRYVTEQVALNASDKGLEAKDAVATTVAGATTNDDVTSADFDYLVKMDKLAGEEYEKSTLTVEVEVQAMQFRNTTDAEWTSLYTDTLNL